MRVVIDGGRSWLRVEGWGRASRLGGVWAMDD